MKGRQDLLKLLVLKRRLGYTRRRFFMEYSIFMVLDADTISQQCLPKHVAIIMDGNGRWAQARNRPRVYGCLLYTSPSPRDS